MTHKQRMLQIMSGESVDVMPVDLMVGTEFLCHHAGVPTMDFFYDSDPRAEQKAQTHVAFLERFEPDAVTLWCRGAPKHWRQRYCYELDGEQAFMVDTKTGKRWPMSGDHYAVFMDELPDMGPYHFERGEVEILVNGSQYFGITDKFDIQSEADIDRLFPIQPAEAVIDSGMFEVTRTMADRCGETEYIECSAISSLFRFALGILGFPDGLIFMREKPDLFRCLVERMLEQNIEYAKAVRTLGADGLHTGDLWAGGDLISQDDWMEFAFPYSRELIRQAKRIGLKVKYYFVGDPGPRLKSLGELGADSLQIEESWGVSIDALREAVGPDMVLHTNIDAIYLMDHGSPAQIQEELAAQVKAAGGPQRLICSLGSELTVNTPPANVETLIAAAHRYPG